jgi:pantoate--beta-alanine ligase
MAADLSFPVEVVPAPTVREPDGLALSSRNVFLSADEREAALSMWRGLGAAADAAEGGERSGSVLESLVVEEVLGAGLDLAYVELAAADDTTRMAVLERPGFLAVAASSGRTRLIDNVWLHPDGTTERGTRLEQPSILYTGGG